MTSCANLKELDLYQAEVKSNEGINGFTSIDIFSTGGTDEVWGNADQECNPLTFSPLDASFDYPYTKDIKNSNMDSILKEIDIKNIVLETDSPYLAPTPFRGKRNEPKYLVFIAEKICKLKNISLDELAYQTNQNIDRVFLKKMIY